LVPCALHLLATQRVGFGTTRFDFLCDSERHLQCQGLDQLQQEIAHRSIHNVAGYTLTHFGASTDRVLLANVSDCNFFFVPPVMNPHALAANTAQHASLQQSRSLPRRPQSARAAERRSVLGQALLIGLKSIPADVARMHVADQKLPLLPGHFEDSELAIRLSARARAAINERPGIARAVQDLGDPAEFGLAPEEFAL